MTACGLIMSRIMYGIEIWGPSASEKQNKQMQVLQNSVMRWICDARRETRTRDLLNMTGMMSDRQLVMYRVLMSGLSACWNDSPRGMSQWTGEKERKLQITSRSFRFVFGKLLSRIPNNLACGDPRKKRQLIKDWILQNIPWNEEKFDGLADESLPADESNDKYDRERK